MTHRELCEIGAKFINNSENYHFRRPFVLIEFCPTMGESPDIYGLSGPRSLLIEVKVSKGDFKRDIKKNFRKSGKGIGLTRYYLCPTGLINENELPENWGLLYCDENKKIEIVKMSGYFFERDFSQELLIMQSVIRRLAVKYQILDFRETK